MDTCTLVAATVLSASSPGRSQHVTYYVLPSDNYSNPGTEAQPFKALARASDMVRTINKNMARGLVVALRGGTYAANHLLVFDERDAGINGHNIIFRSHPGERAAIYGGRKIIGWERDAGNVWKARGDS